jgi:hypothetical protein
MLNAVLSPASAQHIRDKMSRNVTSAMAVRRSATLNGTNARTRASAIEIPPHT